MIWFHYLLIYYNEKPKFKDQELIKKEEENSLIQSLKQFALGADDQFCASLNIHHNN